MTLLHVNSTRLSFHTQGEGPALLLLHGFTGSSATWTPHLPTFEGFTTVAVDLLGMATQTLPQRPAAIGWSVAWTA